MCLCDAGRVFEANKITPSINRDNTNSFFLHGNTGTNVYLMYFSMRRLPPT